MASLTRAAAPSTAVASTMRTLRGVIFDMDGTLTVPVIDFAKMYREVLGPNHPRIVAGSPIDILHEIQEWPTDKQRVAYQVITRHEQEAHERLQIMPGRSRSLLAICLEASCFLLFSTNSIYQKNIHSQTLILLLFSQLSNENR
ncbi:hypothetical protein KP509_07G066800 [Ceratopteris richardii]|uniref:Uncharacterized protein n=1 Tax=Ceratopteris richardii TaxID=49495 RepID=A0A8T2UHU3_CERRI|nr:hypothetical protein KP509_07G066800 [Ceratopteris richardii]